MAFPSNQVSRRHFLSRAAQMTGGWIAASAISRSALANAGTPEAKMRFGLTTYTWGQDWDLPTLMANCRKAGVYGVELRTGLNYAHGIELELSPHQRSETKKRFADGPVRLVGLATSEKFDSVDPNEVDAAVESSKQFIKLSHDLDATGIRVFPNDFHKEVPREKTIAQIAKAVNAVGAFAADYGQQVRLEAHGSAGELSTLRAIMDQVTQPAVRVKLNSDKRDAKGEGFEHNFNLVKDFLGDTVHTHDFKADDFPNQLQIDLLVKMRWTGWVLLEAATPPKDFDRVQGLREQREIWEQMVANSVRAMRK